MHGSTIALRLFAAAALTGGIALASGCAGGGLREAPKVTPVDSGTPVRNEAVDRTALAAQLATQARTANSPIGLLAAAQLLIESGASTLTLTPSGATGASGGAITAENLIAAAEQAGRDNPNVVALAAQLRQRAAAGARGAVGGARVGSYEIAGGATHTFSIAFKAHEPAQVRVHGRGTTELDCAVIGPDGREVARDRRVGDQCDVIWFPLAEGTFRIEVKNLDPGTGNAYVLATN